VITDSDIARLIEILGPEGVSTSDADLQAHSVDESWVDPHIPEVVVWPESAEQVSKILAFANARGIPVSARSGGSSLEGNPIPLYGGIVLAMYRMNQVLEIIEPDLQVRAQPGVVYSNLNKQLRRLGLFFPPAPGSSDVATLGGMVANNSSGMRAVKYGVTRDYVMGLEVVLSDGRIIHTGSRTKKTTSGYDLNDLFIGSEGTLGIVTEITMRLEGLPENIAVAIAPFETLENASHAIYECMRFGLRPAAIEMLDPEIVEVTNRQQGLDLQIRPTVCVEFHGSTSDIQDQMQYLQEICRDNDCLAFQTSTDTESRERLWSARAKAHESMQLEHPGMRLVAGDICVPMSQFGEMIRYAHQVGDEYGVVIYAFGHAGDGNLHTDIVADPADREQLQRALDATDKIVERALEVGGTIAGEHGIGCAKKHLMYKEHGNTIQVMRDIKRLFDPNNILNPGKILPDE